MPPIRQAATSEKTKFTARMVELKGRRTKSEGNTRWGAQLSKLSKFTWTVIDRTLLVILLNVVRFLIH